MIHKIMQGASRGSTLAIASAVLLCWETGQKEKAIALYQKAASLYDSSGLVLIRVVIFVAESPNPKEAVRWLYEPAIAGHVRAQYQLALCLHHGHGVNKDIKKAARWYVKAAEDRYVCAMYNVALCYSFGESFPRSHRQGRQWKKRAANRSHTKAQVQHGLALFSEGEMLKALVYLELASRDGETRGSQVKNVIFQKLSATSRDRAPHLVDNWRVLPPSLSPYRSSGCFI